MWMWPRWEVVSHAAFITTPEHERSEWFNETGLLRSDIGHGKIMLEAMKRMFAVAGPHAQHVRVVAIINAGKAQYDWEPGPGLSWTIFVDIMQRLLAVHQKEMAKPSEDRAVTDVIVKEQYDQHLTWKGKHKCNMCTPQQSCKKLLGIVEPWLNRLPNENEGYHYDIIDDPDSSYWDDGSEAETAVSDLEPWPMVEEEVFGTEMERELSGTTQVHSNDTVVAVEKDIDVGEAMDMLERTAGVTSGA
ncbi:MAG: hypothetical protein M1814_005355 [Vezdaea aestivalis]|nr:MAG: hypothetical protein M1814_005355 [Vezdaea aestivalis]